MQSCEISSESCVTHIAVRLVSNTCTLIHQKNVSGFKARLKLDLHSSHAKSNSEFFVNSILQKLLRHSFTQNSWVKNVFPSKAENQLSHCWMQSLDTRQKLSSMKYALECHIVDVSTSLPMLQGRITVKFSKSSKDTIKRTKFRAPEMLSIT